MGGGSATGPEVLMTKERRGEIALAVLKCFANRRSGTSFLEVFLHFDEMNEDSGVSRDDVKKLMIILDDKSKQEQLDSTP